MSGNFKPTVGRPFRVAIPGAWSESRKAKALPYVLSIKQIKVAEGLISNQTGDNRSGIIENYYQKRRVNPWRGMAARQTDLSII